jgi:hypothetical protein
MEQANEMKAAIVATTLMGNVFFSGRSMMMKAATTGEKRITLKNGKLIKLFLAFVFTLPKPGETLEG